MGLSIHVDFANSGGGKGGGLDITVRLGLGTAERENRVIPREADLPWGALRLDGVGANSSSIGVGVRGGARQSRGGGSMEGKRSPGERHGSNMKATPVSQLLWRR